MEDESGGNIFLGEWGFIFRIDPRVVRARLIFGSRVESTEREG